MNTAPSEEQILIIRDSLSLSEVISNKKLTVYEENNCKKWMDFKSDFHMFLSHFKMIFIDGTLLSITGGTPSSGFSQSDLTTLYDSAFTRFFVTLQSHNYEKIRELARDPQFSKMLHKGRNSNYANIMLMITNHLMSILDLLLDITVLIKKMENYNDYNHPDDESSSDDPSKYNSYFVEIQKKMKHLNVLINGDDVNKDVITRFGAFSFFHGVSRPLDPPFVRLVRFFTNLF
jgi:hypothetical protein